MADNLDHVWKALSDPTRRAILEALRDGPRTTTELVELFPELTRFAVMKHMDVLREAGLMQTRAEGRKRIQIYEHWVSPFADLWASKLLNLKRTLEGDQNKGD